MMTKEVGISCSPLATVLIWECDECHRRWTDSDRTECPFCTSLNRAIERSDNAAR
jgi:ABC-type ATPase with predicted acetyltransferase domain